MAPPNCTSDHIGVPPGRQSLRDAIPSGTASVRIGGTRPTRPGLRDPGPAEIQLRLTTSPGPGGEMLVAADGEIDLRTGAAFSSCVHRAMRHPSCRTLIVDLRRVRFLGACGIDVLMEAEFEAHAHDIRLAVVADHRPVLRPLLLTAVDEHLALFPTPDAARTPLTGTAPDAGVDPG